MRRLQSEVRELRAHNSAAASTPDSDGNGGISDITATPLGRSDFAPRTHNSNFTNPRGYGGYTGGSGYGQGGNDDAAAAATAEGALLQGGQQRQRRRVTGSGGGGGGGGDGRGGNDAKRGQRQVAPSQVRQLVLLRIALMCLPSTVCA